MSKFNESLGLLTTEFEKMVSTNTVIGDPYTVGDVTLVPIISVTLGIGGGGGEGNAGMDSKQAGGTGIGLGGGFRITPIAMVSIHDGEVTMLPITRKSGMLDKLMEMIPTLAEKWRRGKGGTDCCEGEEDEMMHEEEE